MSSVRATWAQRVCAKQSHFLSINSIFSQNNGNFLGFFFHFPEGIFVFDITKCCCSSYWCLPQSALQGGCCLLPVFNREESKGRGWWKLALDRVSSRNLEGPGREVVFWALALCPIRQGNGNILSTESETAYFLGQLERIWQKVRNSNTKNVFFCQCTHLYDRASLIFHQRMSV